MECGTQFRFEPGTDAFTQFEEFCLTPGENISIFIACKGSEMAIKPNPETEILPFQTNLILSSPARCSVEKIHPTQLPGIVSSWRGRGRGRARDCGCGMAGPQDAAGISNAKVMYKKMLEQILTIFSFASGFSEEKPRCNYQTTLKEN
jgi:hypothetical protein